MSIQDEVSALVARAETENGDTPVATAMPEGAVQMAQAQESAPVQDTSVTFTPSLPQIYRYEGTVDYIAEAKRYKELEKAVNSIINKDKDFTEFTNKTTGKSTYGMNRSGVDKIAFLTKCTIIETGRRYFWGTKKDGYCIEISVLAIDPDGRSRPGTGMATEKEFRNKKTGEPILKSMHNRLSTAETRAHERAIKALYPMIERMIEDLGPEEVVDSPDGNPESEPETVAVAVAVPKTKTAEPVKPTPTPTPKEVAGEMTKPVPENPHSEVDPREDELREGGAEVVSNKKDACNCSLKDPDCIPDNMANCTKCGKWFTGAKLKAWKKKNEKK